MAINLNKNRAALLAAWNDVLDDKTSTNWALFGYEGLTNDLKFVSKGANGIEEMMEDLNSGQIMYAFLKIMDPKTSLPKNVLINWQGEGAPNVRKGTCANHVRDVSNFFKGAHVTMNARNEEEVDPQIIIDRVSKATGSVYSFKERTELDNQTGPVGTSYKRVIPEQEINALERDRFWEKEEQEEKQRQEEERRHREEEKKKLEEERKRRETEETAKREEKSAERNRNINQIREAEKIQEVQESLSRQKIFEDSESEDKQRRERAEILRRQRKAEAQELIAKRTIDARAVFEQNPCALNRRRASCQPNQSQRLDETSPDVSPNEQPVVKPARKGSLPTWPTCTTDTAQQETNLNKNGFAIKTEKNNCDKGLVEENAIEEEQEWEDEVKHEVTPASVTANEIEPVEPKFIHELKSEEPSQFSNGEYGLTARALYDYQADDETEISFDPGDIITHIDQIDEGWWQGLGPHGVFGLFPANYVELIK